jgi:hypothetical protein
MAPVYGQQARQMLAFQTGFESAFVATSMRPFRFISDTTTKQAGFQPDPVIGGALENDFDTPELQQDMETVDGQLVVPVCARQVGDLLRLLMGDPTKTGTGTVTHTYRSGRAPRFGSVERRLVAARHRRFHGYTLRTMQMSFEKGNGNQQITFGTAARQETEVSTPAATPAAERTYRPLLRRSANFLLNAVAAVDVQAAEFTYTSGLAPIQYMDGGNLTSGMELDADGTVTGSITVRTDSATYHTLADGGAVQSLQFSVADGANFQLAASIRAKFNPTGVPIAGRGGQQTQFSFTGQATAANPMLTVLLVNDVADYLV